MFEAGRGYHEAATSQEHAALLAEARQMRAEAFADYCRRALAAVGRLLHPLTAPIARARRLGRLRDELAGLDERTLRDLGLTPASAAAVTPESLADHPMAVQAQRRRGAANENRGPQPERRAA